MKILVCGLPGAGKTYLAERLSKDLESCAWYNADVIRGAANDWDFSPEGRQQKSFLKEMKQINDKIDNLDTRLTKHIDFIEKVYMPLQNSIDKFKRFFK